MEYGVQVHLGGGKSLTIELSETLPMVPVMITADDVRVVVTLTNARGLRDALTEVLASIAKAPVA